VPFLFWNFVFNLIFVGKENKHVRADSNNITFLGKKEKRLVYAAANVQKPELCTEALTDHSGLFWRLAIMKYSTRFGNWTCLLHTNGWK
jgi:hypothetical protein